jgi:hypothetical protein
MTVNDDNGDNDDDGDDGPTWDEMVDAIIAKLVAIRTEVSEIESGDSDVDEYLADAKNAIYNAIDALAEIK